MPTSATTRHAGRIRRSGWPAIAAEISYSAGSLLLAAVLLAGLVLRCGADPALPALGFVAFLGVVLARIDIAMRRLPFAITVPSFGATFVLLTPAVVVDGWHPMARAFGSGLAWLGLFAAVAGSTRGRGMGWGDVVLAPTLGLSLGWLGWGESIVGLVAGFALAAVTAVLLILIGAATRRSIMPFGPFMLAGTAIGAFVGDPLWTALAGTGA